MSQFIYAKNIRKLRHKFVVSKQFHIGKGAGSDRTSASFRFSDQAKLK